MLAGGQGDPLLGHGPGEGGPDQVEPHGQLETGQGEAVGDDVLRLEVRPATCMVEVSNLIDPALLVEIEAGEVVL